MSHLDESKARRVGGKAGDASIVVLIGANLIPLAGVLIWGWNTFQVVVLYWLENVIIGGINILKMLTCAPDPDRIDMVKKAKQRIAERAGSPRGEEAERLGEFEGMIKTHGGKLGMLNHGSKLFFIPFFTVHYGLFCFVHGAFVFSLLENTGRPGGFPEGGPGLDGLLNLIREAVAAGGIWAAMALVFSHLFSFAFNYLGKGEFRRTVVPVLMMAPYGRVVVLHMAVLFGAFAILALGSPVFLLVLLIVGKILLDWVFHRRAHRKVGDHGRAVAAHSGWESGQSSSR